MTIANEIKVNFQEFNGALAEADKLAVDSEQDFDNETTLFKFTDDSKLKFDGVSQSIEAI